MSSQKVIAPIVNLARSIEGSSTTAIVAGFSFASAIAWMDFVRFIISNIVKVQKNGGEYYFLTALATTALAAIVYMIAKRLGRTDVSQKGRVVYAVR